MIQRNLVSCKNLYCIFSVYPGIVTEAAVKWNFLDLFLNFISYVTTERTIVIMNEIVLLGVL